MDTYADVCDGLESGSELNRDLNIAIVDTIFEPGDDFRQYNRVGRKVNPLDLRTDTLDESNAEMTNTHGINVLNIMTSLAKNPVYHFYTTIPEPGEFLDRHMIATFRSILDFSDEIDLINISAGLDHITEDRVDCNEYGPACMVCELAREILDEGISIVAGAGNRPHTENLCCPSLESDVISVGGCTVDCTAEIENDSVWGAGMVDNIRPPNALWIDRDDDEGAKGTYCSGRGCYPGSTCSDNRQVKMWDGTPTTDTGKPDILAPMLYPAQDENGPYLAYGTSYSAPVVTGEIGNIINIFKSEMLEPSPAEIRAAIERGGEPVPDAVAPLFNALHFANSLGENYNLEFETTGDDLYDIS